MTSQAISLLDGIDRTSGEIIDKKHELYGESIAGVELHFPKSSGSTVGVMTLLELKENHMAPAKIVLQDPDTNVIAGCILAGIPIEIENLPPKPLPASETAKLSHLPQFLQDLLIKEAEILNARGFIPVDRVQIAGVSYKTIGDAGIKVLEYFARKNIKFTVPTTLNPAGMDLDAWKEQGISGAFALKQRRIIKLLEWMGATLSISCVPYDLVELTPRTHVAFGESSAVAYINSVLNVKTNRENAVKTLISAMSGFTTNIGMHIEENRTPDVEIQVDCPLKGRADYGALGYFAGLHATIPYYRGIKPKSTELKALAAAGAASGSIPLFFIEEKSSMQPKSTASIKNSIHFTETDLRQVYSELTTTSNPPDLISLGCPHLNLSEIEVVLQQVQGKKFLIPVWLSTARAFKAELQADGMVGKLKRSNIFIYSDCCVVVSPIESLGYSTIGTDSAKAAKYLPLFSKCDVVFKPFEDFVKLYSK